MLPIRNGLIVLGMLLCLTTPTAAEVSIGIGLPHVNIRLNLPLYPELVLVPGYPVYYAPRLEANYFFYDGLYWVYLDDNWYASDWYNGPWWLADPENVPLFILRIPIRFYRQPPLYFYDWWANDPPHWGDRWGHDWDHRHRGWNRWQRNTTPAPAPLPDYQRGYDRKHYPRKDEQQRLHGEHYRYQPRDETIREHFAPGPKPAARVPDQRGRQAEPRTSPQNYDRRTPQPQNSPTDRNTQPPRLAPQPAPQQERRPTLRAPLRDQSEAVPRVESGGRPQGYDRGRQERGDAQGSRRGDGQEQEHGQEQEREQGRVRD